MGRMGDLWLGTYDELIHDWTQGNIDDDEFKKFDKIEWKLNLVDTVLLIIVVAVILVSLYV